ncbi:MAG: Rpn family recombination-promoting nuclease/putative transposase [Pirellulaceae bacterium]|nr:Rpn family recombination-promoting nuclease/putative transposase [Planctomycetales bacterium]MCA9264864.1 Rpn family recombination-promoting nuclease/putative transposase [Planctomycetales bacterium]
MDQYLEPHSIDNHPLRMFDALAHATSANRIAYVYVQFEHKSKPDQTTAVQLLTYIVRKLLAERRRQASGQ